MRTIRSNEYLDILSSFFSSISRNTGLQYPPEPSLVVLGGRSLPTTCTSHPASSSSSAVLRPMAPQPTTTAAPG
eukprot:CAMPEP_0173399586 /NCGR_PEP_ID=MMETSP1356-20130122/45341_1 /TAXON_ID=77927 ORGANISM="Hemiselmis virescens, Strain PCC157" /NCGR_SAMPLE_ID=MMETSP1356 /ASSEMBLY_ACC=CAM_ASM_000847 /LENGTH=73 /DNA_ID=CAMNT_0014359329 /DNA_START=59 /DNA_END=276 /DNA_ORIENTATION=-